MDSIRSKNSLTSQPCIHKNVSFSGSKETPGRSAYQRDGAKIFRFSMDARLPMRKCLPLFALVACWLFPAFRLLLPQKYGLSLVIPIKDCEPFILKMHVTSLDATD